MITRATLILLCLILGQIAHANPRGSTQRLRAHITTLTQPAWEGRATGKGAIQAVEWLEIQMREMGLEPAGETGYRLAHNVPIDMKRSATFQIGDRTLALDHEFELLSFTDNTDFNGAAHFVGYGIQAPHLNRDDYADRSVFGSVVLVLTGVPRALDGKLKAADQHLGTMESKAAVALANGARAVVFVNDARNHGSLSDQREDALGARRIQRPLTGIAALRVRKEPLTSALGALGFDLHQAQQTLDEGGVVNFDTPISLRVDVQRTQGQAVNLIGRVPGTSGPAIILAAHYDGLPSEMTEKGYTGADDNASGVAIVLEAASRLAKSPPVGRSLYVVFHDAEELGLHGSRRSAHWLRDQGIRGDIINLDMVGRLRDPGLRVHALGEDCLKAERLGKKEQLRIVCDRPETSPSDHLPYMDLGFGALSLTTGRSVHYHTVEDTKERLNYSGMAVITDFVVGLVQGN